MKLFKHIIILLFFTACTSNENKQVNIPIKNSHDSSKINVKTSPIKETSKPKKIQVDTLIKDSNHVDSITYIMTNFYDLKGSFKDSLKSVLNTQDLSRLGNENVNVLMNFADDYLFKNDWKSYSKYHGMLCWDLPDWVDTDLNRGFCGVAKDLQKNILAYCIYRIDRSPENLLLIYQTYRSWFISKLHLLKNGESTINYDRTVNSYNLIDLLLEMHSTIIKLENHKKFLIDIYEKHDLQIPCGDTVNAPFENCYYWEHKYGDLGFRNLYDGMYQPSSWALSFWTRRHHEGNMEVVHEILLDLKKELDKINYKGDFK